MNPTRNHEVAVRFLALLSGLRIQRCHELSVGCRRGSDATLLWLWHRPAATALIRLLAWEPPYAAGVALEKAKRQKKKKKKKERKKEMQLLEGEDEGKGLLNIFLLCGDRGI